MKKKLKVWILSITGVVILGSGILVYNYYGLYKNITADPIENSSDTTDETEIENPFDKIGNTRENFADKSKQTKDDGNLEVTGNYQEKDKNNPESSKSESSGIDENYQEDNKTATDKNHQKDHIPKKQTLVDKQAKDPEYVDVVGPYKQRFQNLQNKQEGQMNALVNQAKAEYTQAKKSGKTTAGLVVKYASEAKKLESRSQKEFNGLKNDLRHDLKGQSYEPAIVKEVEDYYQQRKNSMQSQILGKIKGS